MLRTEGWPVGRWQISEVTKNTRILCVWSCSSVAGFPTLEAHRRPQLDRRAGAADVAVPKYGDS